MHKFLRSKIILSVCPTILIVPILAFAIAQSSSKKLDEYKKFILTDVNNISQNTSNLVSANFIKGADVSSYASVIEGFLFDENIKKSDGTHYTYKDIENSEYTIWDENRNSMVTVADYINNNLYSYIDNFGNRIYDNMFQILRDKGFNSLRLRFWVNPYDEDGNSYGGGHNDLETNLFIIKQAIQYGFNDFLIDIHYSDFWADPYKSFIPKSWVDLDEVSLCEVGYRYTYNLINAIHTNFPQLTRLRVQFGNEIDNGFLWRYNNSKNKIIKPDYDFLCKFINRFIDAVEDFINDTKVEVNTNLHLTLNDNYVKELKKYNDALTRINTIQLSAYLGWGQGLNLVYDSFKKIKDLYPDKNIIIGETAIPFTANSIGWINDQSDGVWWSKKWSEDIQAVTIFQTMQVLSKLMPDMETGIYWWEIGQLYEGYTPWATKSGMEYYQGFNYKKWQDVNNWSSSTCFDKNGIALPSLDVIKNFDRNINMNEAVIYEPSYFWNNYNDLSLNNENVFYLLTNLVFKQDIIDDNKRPLTSCFYDNNGINIVDKSFDIQIYANDYDSLNFETLYQLVLKNIFDNYYDVLWSQIDISDFSYKDDTKIGKIKFVSKPDSFYYKGDCELTFKVYSDYFDRSIDLSDQLLDINANDQYWYKSIIEFIKNQPNFAFNNQIYENLHISGGATDDNNLWLYDNEKQVDRNAEFYLLDTNFIFLSDNTVNIYELNNHKFWVDDLQNFKGEQVIYFAIQKGINDINWEYNIPSTYSLVGKESWKYIDLLVYKLRINVID